MSSTRFLPFSRRASIAIAVWFVCVLLVPVLAFLEGNRSENIDQRAFQPWPGVEPTHLLDSRYYRRLDRFLTDHLPIRDEAIRTQAEGLVRTRPQVNGVVEGGDGYLFLTEEQSIWCPPPMFSPQVVDAIARARQTLTDHGIDSVVAITPDKFVIMADKVPAWLPGLACARDQDRALRAELERRPEAGVPDLWTTLLQRRTETSRPIFWKLDSHLAGEGRTIAVQTIVDALAPGTFDEGATVERPDTTEGDLALLQGLRRSETLHARLVQRRDVAIVTDSQHPANPLVNITAVHTTGTGRVIPGRTVVIHDSQFGNETWRDQLAPWFEQATFVHWDLLSDPRAVAALRKADHVVIESVERYRFRFVSTLPPVLDAAFGH